MKLVFLGPPGSGKGTQAKLLAEKLKVPHVSLGDILREEVRRGSEIGNRAKALINAGQLVPDEITIELTRQRLAQPDCQAGFILDGFPRSPAQAEALDKMTDPDKVLYFEVDEDRVVDRLSGRRSCKKCGAVYHVKYAPAKNGNKCDSCGEELYQRKDDEESAIRTRFEVYAKQTQPLIERYQKTGKLATVNAGGSIDEILEQLLTLIGYGKN